MVELIEKNLNYLSTLTKEEADFISNILNWDREQQAAFKFAKIIFEKKED